MLLLLLKRRQRARERERERERKRERAERSLSNDMRRDASDATTTDNERGSQTALVRHVGGDERQKYPWN